MILLTTLLRWISGLILLFSVWLLPYQLESTVSGPEAGAPSVPEYFMRQMRYVLLAKGKLELEMFSDTAEFRLEQHELNASVVRGDFYNEKNEVSKIQSDFANYKLEKRLLHLRDNVVCETQDHFFMRTPEAEYDLNRKLFKALRDVSGNTQDDKLRFWSDSAESLIDTRTANLYGSVRTEHDSPKQGLTKISADRALIDRGEEGITYFDKVKILQEKYEVDSKTASLFYARPTKEVQYMVARDDVRIKEKGGRHTRSQEAQFSSPTNTIVLIGFPLVYDGDDVVSGDRITMYRNTGVIEVTSVNALVSEERRAQESATGSGSKALEAPPQKLSEEDKELIP
jgi:LPS export ABC transporter protein LptC